MRIRDAVLMVLLALNLGYMASRRGDAWAASAPRPRAFQSGAERSLPLLREIRDALNRIDRKMDTLIQVERDAARLKR